MVRKINFLTVLSALVLFWLPWMDLRCNGRSLATQTGFQSIHGAASPSQEMRLNGGLPLEETEHAKVPNAPLIAGALLALAGALAAALRGLFLPRSSDHLTGAFCGMALLLISIQWVTGFPIERHAREVFQVTQPGYRTYDPSAGFDPSLAILALDVEARPMPALYLQLILLGIPTLISGGAVIALLRKRLGSR